MDWEKIKLGGWSDLGGAAALATGLLAIHAIAAAHQARLTAMPQPKGGLCIEVAFAARSHARDHLVGTSEAALRRATDGTYNDAELASRLRHAKLRESAAALEKRIQHMLFEDEIEEAENV